MVLNSDWTSWPCGNSTRKVRTGKTENRKEREEGTGKWEEKVEREEEKRKKEEREKEEEREEEEEEEKRKSDRVKYRRVISCMIFSPWGSSR